MNPTTKFCIPVLVFQQSGHLLKQVISSITYMQCCPLVRNFEGNFWPPSAFSGDPFEIFDGHICETQTVTLFFTKAELVPIICPKIEAGRKTAVMHFSSSPLNNIYHLVDFFSNKI